MIKKHAKAIIAITVPLTIALIAAQIWFFFAVWNRSATVEYHVEVIERTETVYTDLNDLRQDFANIAEQLRQECLYIIEVRTGDPMPGIINLIDRHYQGDACRAADEVLRGEW